MTEMNKAKCYTSSLMPRFAECVDASIADSALCALNCSRYVIFPGFCDVHVHFREPGFSYKETIATGSLASAHGGYTAVCTMPNLNPVPDPGRPCGHGPLRPRIFRRRPRCAV